MLDLQRVKQRLETQSSIPSLPSLSFNRISNTLGSIGAQLEPRDVWGDVSTEVKNANGYQYNAVKEGNAVLDTQTSISLSSSQSSMDLRSAKHTTINTALMWEAEVSSQDQLQQIMSQ